MSISDSKFRDLLKQLKGFDGDERVMAILDMKKAVEADRKVRPALQEDIKRDIFKALLEDPNGDAKSSASTFFASCTQYFADATQKAIVDAMGTHVATEKKRRTKVSAKVLAGEMSTKREVGHAVKKIIQNASTKTRAEIGPGLAMTLLTVLERKSVHDPKKQAFDIEMICLDVIRDVLMSVGSAMPEANIGDIQRTLFGLLGHHDGTLRLSVSATIGPLVTCLPDESLKTMTNDLLNGARRAQGDFRVTYVSTLSVVSDFAGSRIADSVQQSIQVLGTCCARDANSEASDQNHAIWEESLKAFASILQKCPTGVSGTQVQEVLRTAMSFLRYDPLFDGDAVQEEEEE
jgi:hypothetical protein